MNFTLHLQEFTKIQVINTLYSFLVTVEESRVTHARFVGLETSWVTLEGKGSFETKGHHVYYFLVTHITRHPHHPSWCCKLITSLFIFYFTRIMHITYTRHTPFILHFLHLQYICTRLDTLGKGLTISFLYVQYIYIIRSTNSLAHP